MSGGLWTLKKDAPAQVVEAEFKLKIKGFAPQEAEVSEQKSLKIGVVGESLKIKELWSFSK